MGEISMKGFEAEWTVVAAVNQEQASVVIRSRAANPPVQALILRSMVTRVRCILPPHLIREDGMPVSTEDVEAYEIELLAGLEKVDDSACLFAVVTGAGCRDFYFASMDTNKILKRIKRLRKSRQFNLQIGHIRTPTDGLLAFLGG